MFTKIRNINLQRGIISKRFIIIGVIALVLVLAFSRIIVSKKAKGSQSITGSSIQESKRTAYVDVNKSFEFKAIDVNKKEIPVTFTIVSAERKDDIKVKGEDRKPVSGKDYLLIRVEIQNNQTQRVAIATADRIRLDDNGRLFAPDYHNGNVVVDPISTKKDLIAFAVNADQKSFSFQVGELNGEKQKIEVNF
jgi:hypothetical protein